MKRSEKSAGAFTDATTIPAGSVLDCDVVVVGAGAAGITVASELVDSGLDVLLIEGGGSHFERQTQNLYDGEVDDPAHHGGLMQYRRRMFGGTTTVWGGRCSPFDDSDFEKRDGVPHSGWPVTGSEMRPFYRRAHEYVDVGDFTYDVAAALPDAPRELIAGLRSDTVLQDRLWRFSLPTNFGRKNRQRLSGAPNVTMLLHANTLKLTTNESGSAVTGLRVSSLVGNVFSVRARRYVLATGGLETTRLLLVSNDVNLSGLGNERDLVGRFYSSHISGDLGQVSFLPQSRAVVWDYERAPGGVYCKRQLRIAEDVQRQLGLLNFRCNLSHPPFDDASHGSAVLSAAYLAKGPLRHRISPEYSKELALAGYQGLRPHFRNIVMGAPQLAGFGVGWLAKRTLRSRKFPSVSLKSRSNTYTLHFDAEQAPNFDSRVCLSDQVDELGVRRLRVEWRHSEIDIESASRCYGLIAEEFERAGVARVGVPADAIADVVRENVGVGSHHIGTTRMSEEASRGVVDKNCRVHSIENLYVAGPSVFCTASFANPVLTTTAFAIRLGDHLKTLR